MFYLQISQNFTDSEITPDIKKKDCEAPNKLLKIITKWENIIPICFTSVKVNRRNEGKPQITNMPQ